MVADWQVAEEEARAGFAEGVDSGEEARAVAWTEVDSVVEE